MKRWFQFSVKSALLLLTGVCVWLAIVSQHARRQAATAAEVKALGGVMYYEHQNVARWRAAPCYDRFREPPVSPWLRKQLGDDFFREVAVIDLSKTEASDAEIARFGASLPQAAIRCPASWARRHGSHNIWPSTQFHYDPISLAITLVSLAFTAWVVGLSYRFLRRKPWLDRKVQLPQTGFDCITSRP